MPTLILTRAEVKNLIDMPEVIRAVEQAFRDWIEGRAQMPPKSYLQMEKGDFRAMPASLPGAVCIKWVNVHTGNPLLGLATVMGVIIYSDPETGYPLAVMDGSEITAYRTGAAAAIASKYLARKDSKVLGLVGAGRQAYTQLMAHAVLFPLTEVKVADPLEASVKKLMAAFPTMKIKYVSVEEACKADIICTITPARGPVVKAEWIKGGTHINAIGADAKGKEELEPAILNRARVVVDDIRQAVSGGEINVPVARGLFNPKDIYGDLSEVITGRKPGRTDNKMITVFDSTGVAIEDVATARIIHDRAKADGKYLSVKLVD